MTKEQGWQPIETADKNRRRLLVFVPKYGPFTGHFDEKWHIAGLYAPDQPTHWMPLPEPPE